MYMLCISCLEDSQVEIPKIIHVKMLNNEEIMSFPHYLVVNHCNADDFELGENLIIHLLLESVQYSLFLILRKFQV